jgi:hypothetical protein
MTNITYLVVKTGRSGAKINDCYDATITKDGRTIRLAGDYRLTGSWFRAITRAVKSQGITGTLSVFKHTTEDADALIAGHNRTLLMLKNNLDWKPVARIDSDDIDTVTFNARQRAWNEFEEAGLIRVNKRDRQGNMTNYSLPDLITDNIKRQAGWNGADEWFNIRRYNSLVKVEYKRLQNAADEMAEYAVVPLVKIL